MDLKLQEIGQRSKGIFSMTARLAKSPGPASTHAELMDSVREAMQEMDRDLRYAQTFVEDEDDYRTRQEQKLTIMKYCEDLATHRKLYRKAVMKAKNNLEETSKAELAALIAASAPSKIVSSESDSKGTNKADRRTRRDENASNAVLSSSSDVTAELRRTHSLMSEELSKSALSQELLAQSSATLSTLNDEYNVFGTILNGSKRLLKELENADRADQLWIWGSFGFFCLVVAWVLYRRILSRPVSALMWTGSFMFSRINRAKIIESRREAQQVKGLSSTRSSLKSDGTLKSAIDVAIESVVPDLGMDDDDETRMNRARVREPSKEYDIIHAEL